MLKQYSFSNLNINYVYLPNLKNEVLTSDGIKIDISKLKTISPIDYENLKNTDSLYDYTKSKLAETLVLKESINSKGTTDGKKLDIIVENETEKDSNYRVSLDKIFKQLKPKSKRRKKHFNLFEDLGRFFMLLVSIGTGILSIFYTTEYLCGLDNPLIVSFLLSSTMYIFGLFGINFSYTFKNRGNKKLSVLFLICSILTISASIFSSADVNMSNYLKNVDEREQALETKKGQTLKVQILQDELDSNDKQIEILQKDIETQSKVYVRAWSNRINDFITVEGKITESAQNQIDKDKENIEIISLRNKEINKQLLELADNGVSFKENTKKRSMSLSEVLGKLFHIDSDYIHLVILLFYSCFIDIVSVLGMTAFYRLKETKSSKKK